VAFPEQQLPFEPPPAVAFPAQAFPAQPFPAQPFPVAALKAPGYALSPGLDLDVYPTAGAGSPTPLTKKEIAFWLLASIACLLVVLQRNGMLHQLSKATGSEPQYLQLEYSLSGPPDVTTRRGLAARAKTGPDKSSK
jgi:hypothetical protein